MKQRDGRKKQIDASVDKLLDECKRKGLDPEAQGVPMGDNCDGYPILKYLEQGYDVDP